MQGGRVPSREVDRTPKDVHEQEKKKREKKETGRAVPFGGAVFVGPEHRFNTTRGMSRFKTQGQQQKVKKRT